MKKLAFTFISILFLGIGNIRAKGDFWYDKQELDNEFCNIDTSLYTNYLKYRSSVLPSDTSDFTIYDIDLEPFCTGLCCGPVGLTIFTNKDLTTVEKKSFWLGCGTFTVSIVAGLAGLIILEESFFFF